MGKRDQERFLHLKAEDPNYVGFRGATRTVGCVKCGHKWQVPARTFNPNLASTFICVSCRTLSLPTPHQKFHLDAVLRDSLEIPVGIKRDRVIKEANDLLDGVVAWPAPGAKEIEASDISDWIEEPERRGDFSLGARRG